MACKLFLVVISWICLSLISLLLFQDDIHNLVSNGNFEKKLQHWKAEIHSQQFSVGRLYPKIDNYFGSFPSTAGIFNELTTDFMMQIIWVKKEIKSPLMISFSHILSHVHNDSKIFQYVNIRYSDGTIFPIYNFIKDVSKHHYWKKDCLVVPSIHKKIENIVIGIGGYDFKYNERQLIAITNIGIHYNKQIILNDINFYKKYKNKCDSIKLIKKDFQNYKTEINKFKSIKIFNKNDVTICIPITIERLNFIKLNSKYYDGPISISIYLKNKNELLKLKLFLKKNKEIRMNCTFHLIYQNEETNENPRKNDRPEYSFPINYLRNIARKYSNTNYILYLDGDFIVSSTLFNDLKLIKKNKKKLIILPSYRGIYSKDKLELLKNIKLNVTRRIEYTSHDLTNYTKFENINYSNEFYKVGMNHNFEPYYISHRSVPLFSERYVGCGRDKVSQSHSTHLANFSFWVWMKNFVVHLPIKNEQKICKKWPPPKFQLHTMMANHFISLNESSSKKFEIEDEFKNTILSKNDEELLLQHHNQLFNSLSFLIFGLTILFSLILSFLKEYNL
eukprot:gene2426-3137_t